jgi:YVTN family beta-propeller protein
MRTTRLVLLSGCTLFVSACGGSEAADSSSGGLGSSATGGGTSDGGESGGDESGAGTDGDGTGGGFSSQLDLGEPPEPPPPPEIEEEGDFRVPRSSGRYVYSANETTDRVAVIDTTTLLIEVVDVGHQPSVVAPIPDQPGDTGAVAVLTGGSNEVTFVRSPTLLSTSVELREIAEGANALVVSPDGGHAISFHDVDGPPVSAGSDQEITVLETQAGGTEYRLTVGAHPRGLEFAPDSSVAYVITDDGVNVIDMLALAAIDKPPLVPVIPDTGLDPSLVEIQVSAVRGQAIARQESELWIAITDLETEVLTEIQLPRFPTDLDVSGDGTFALATAPTKTEGSWLFQIPLPISGPNDFAVQNIVDEYVGVAQLGAGGDVVLLYTTVDPWAEDGEVSPIGDPRRRVTVARRDAMGGLGDQVTFFSEIPVQSVGIAPDGLTAVMLHGEAPQLNLTAPWPYTLLDLSTTFPIKKVQMAEARPSFVLFTPNGERAALTIRDDDTSLRVVDMVNLDNFIVDPLNLGAPPAGLGYVEDTDKIFISQDQASGRITFVDGTGMVETATGYELNDEIKD